MNMTTLILFGSFVLFLVLGLPVSISLGLSSLVSFFYCGIPIVTIAQRLYTGMDSFPLMAIPLFILAGNLMTAGGISRKIVDFANILTGRVRGGLAYTAILACAIFAALSGSGPATTIAIGAMIYPSMKEIKYPEAQSAVSWPWRAVSAPSSRRASSWSFTAHSSAAPLRTCSLPVSSGASLQ